MNFNQSSSQLAIGFENGEVKTWDVNHNDEYTFNEMEKVSERVPY